MKDKNSRKKVSRTGRVQVGAWINQELYRQLKHIAVEQDMTVGLVLEDAVSVYVAQHKQRRES